MSQSSIKDFTKGNIVKQISTFALPLLLSNLLQVLYNMVDMMVVGNVMGQVGLSAVSVGGDISNLLTFIAMGFANAGQVIIARYIGSNNRERIGKFVGTMSGFLLISAVVLSVIGLIFQNNLLSLMNTPKEAYAEAARYSMVCMIGLVFIYGYNVVSAILRGMGDSKHPFIFISIAAVINVLLDFLFVKDLKMGAMGAALATIISQAASFISCTIFLIIKRKQFELNAKLKDFIFLNKKMVSDLVKLGVPMAIKSASVMVSKLFVNSFINGYGIAVSAFSGIANKIGSIANLISMAMNTAGSTMVGQNLAAREFARVKKIMKWIAVITITTAVIMSAIYIAFPGEIVDLFIDNITDDVLKLAVEFIPVAILIFFAAAGRAIMNALLNGSGDYKINFVTAIMDGIVMRIGLAVLLGLVFNMKHMGFWMGDAIAGFTPFFIGVVFYMTGKWKK